MVPAITAVVVSYGDPGACSRAVASLLAQTHAPLEVIVLDNDPAGGAAAAVANDPSMRNVVSIRPGTNFGYTRAANLAASRARGDWLFFLNPDAVAERDCIEQLLLGVDGPNVGLLGAQVLLPDGRVNAGENPINIAGLCWSGGYGRSRERGASRDTGGAVSGAALMVRRADLLALGGLCPDFFMYMDDADLAWRMRMAGRRVRYCPQAVVVHDYRFEKGAHKWFYLERNRGWALLSNLQLRTLVLLAPVLILTEAAVVRHAISQGWLVQKLCAWGSLVANTPRVLAWRHTVQAGRNVSDYGVLAGFSGAVETQMLVDDVPAWANRWLDRYRRLLLLALRHLA